MAALILKPLRKVIYVLRALLFGYADRTTTPSKNVLQNRNGTNRHAANLNRLIVVLLSCIMQLVRISLKMFTCVKFMKK